MNFSECLNTADVLTLRKIADRYEFTCSKHSKMALLQEILFTFRDPDFLQRQMTCWIAGRESLLLRLCLDNRNLFSLEEVEGALQTAGCAADTVTSATTEGWLFATTRYAGRLMYCIPQELHGQLRNRLVKQFAAKISVRCEDPLTWIEEDTAMARDVDVLLEFASTHELQTTVDGSLYKRHLLQLLELLEIAEQPLTGGWRFGYGRRFHDYPDRFALMYDYAYHQHLITESPDGRLVVTEAADAWRRQPEIERQRALVRFYLALYRRSVPRLPQIAQLLALIASPWVDSQSMLAALGPLVRDYYYDSRSDVWEKRILRMLAHLGLVRLGGEQSPTEWFQTTKLGQQLLTPDVLPVATEEEAERRRIVIVQPNFDIVVTADQPLVTAELSIFAELHQAGAVRVYRVTEESVRRGTRSGRQVGEWLHFLQRHAQSPVPGNVEQTLLEWQRRYGPAPKEQREDVSK